MTSIFSLLFRVPDTDDVKQESPKGDFTDSRATFFFWEEGAAVHTQATIKPCRRPLRDIESHVRLKRKLIGT